MNIKVGRLFSKKDLIRIWKTGNDEILNLPTCPHCRQMEPYFDQYSEDYKDKIIFAKVDISKSPTIAARYGVMGTPTFKFYCKGKPVHGLTGAMYPTLIKKAVEESLEHGEDCVNSTTWQAPEITGYG